MQLICFARSGILANLSTACASRETSGMNAVAGFWNRINKGLLIWTII